MISGEGSIALEVTRLCFDLLPSLRYGGHLRTSVHDQKRLRDGCTIDLDGQRMTKKEDGIEAH